MTEKVRQKGERPSAHELFTPLNHIIGYSELLEEQAGAQGRGDAVRRLRVIANAGRRLKSLLSETFEPIPAMDAPLRIPLLEADAAAVSDYDLRSMAPLHGRLLVVDDDEDNREVLTERLTARGFTVVVATNGVEALNAVSASEFDIVLLDIMMPASMDWKCCETSAARDPWPTSRSSWSHRKTAARTWWKRCGWVPTTM